MVANFGKNLRHDLRMFWLMWRTQFAANSRLRFAFALQVFGMIVNNAGILVAWLFLFEKFGTINGWSGLDFVGVQGITMLVFGLIMTFTFGITELPRYVDQGTFDTFLTKPSSILLQVASSKIEVAVLGDLTLGAIMLVFYIVVAHISLMALLFFVLALTISFVLMFCFVLGPYLLAFYLFDSDKVARSIMQLFTDMGVYPTGFISGWLRSVLLTVFPGMMAFVMPLNVLRGQQWEYIFYGAIVAAFWLGVTMWLFKRSVRKYESANLVGAR